MREPKVILPENYIPVVCDDRGLCKCPCCPTGDYYMSIGHVIECEDCKYHFPVNWWSDYSKGVNDVKRLERGGERTGGMERRRELSVYYREGFDNPPEEDAWKAKDEIDWRTLQGEGKPSFLHWIQPFCERCGKDKEHPNRSGLCNKCEAATTCKHRVSMLKKQCKACVVMKDLVGDLEYTNPPCYFGSALMQCECPSFEPQGIEGVEGREASIALAIARMMASGPIVAEVKKEHKGRDWKGIKPCPICNGTLHMTHAAYNGHVHGRCETNDCLDWME